MMHAVVKHGIFLHRVHEKYEARYLVTASSASVNLFGHDFMLDSIDSRLYDTPERFPLEIIVCHLFFFVYKVWRDGRYLVLNS